MSHEELDHMILFLCPVGYIYTTSEVYISQPTFIYYLYISQPTFIYYQWGLPVRYIYIPTGLHLYTGIYIPTYIYILPVTYIYILPVGYMYSNLHYQWGHISQRNWYIYPIPPIGDPNLHIYTTYIALIGVLSSFIYCTILPNFDTNGA